MKKKNKITIFTKIKLNLKKKIIKNSTKIIIITYYSEFKQKNVLKLLQIITLNF